MPDSIFNKEAFFKHLGGDKELGNEILMVYVVDAPARVESLVKALNDDDTHQVIKFAHALKGISATIRAENITAIAESMERSARKGDLGTVKNKLPLIMDELQLVLENINSVLAS